MNELHLLFSPWRRPRKLTFSASIKTDFPVGPLTAAGLKLNIKHHRTGERKAFPGPERIIDFHLQLDKREAHPLLEPDGSGSSPDERYLLFTDSVQVS